MRTQCLAILMVILSLGFTTARAESISVLIEKAVYEEKTVGDLDKAIQLYEKIIALADADRRHAATAHYRLANCHMKKGDRAQARETLETLLSRYPEQEKLAVRARGALAKLKPTSPAPRVLNSVPATMATDVDPNLTSISVTFDRSMQVDSWSWTGDPANMPEINGKPSYDKNRIRCTLPVKLEPGRTYWVGINSPSHQNFRSEEGNPAERYVILFATKDRSGKPTPLSNTLVAQYEQAAGKRKVSKEDRLKAEQLQAKGWKLWQKQQLPEAEKLFEQAVAQNPELANAWNGLGWARFNQGMPMNAEKAFLRCLEIEPKHAAAWNGLGWIEKGRGDTSAAITNWEKAIQAAPTATASLNGLAKTYMELGKYDLAVKYYKIWLGVAPSDQSAQAGLREAEAKGGKAPDEKTADRTSGEPLVIGKAPWSNDEVSRYRMKAPGGLVLGTMIWETHTTEEQGKPAWAIVQRTYTAIIDQALYSKAIVEKDTFHPLKSEARGPMGFFAATYGDTSVALTATTGGQTNAVSITAPGPVFDNDQVLYLIRCLPLAKGYTASFPILPIQGGIVGQCRIKVTNRNQVTVPAGTFDCHEVKLEVLSQGVGALVHRLWFTADEEQRLVQYDAGGALIELLEVVTRKQTEGFEFTDSAAGISLKVPAGWEVYNNPAPGNYKLTAQLLSPGLASWGSFLAADPAADISARKIAEKDIEILKGYFDGYTVRPDSWVKPKLGGLDAATYQATYRHGGKKMVEYRTYTSATSGIFWFVFRVEETEFEKHKSELDAIVQSFSVN